MKRLFAFAILALHLSAQTNIYLRASGPQAQVITGATNATPIVITTQFAHGFSSTCSTSSPCYCAVEALATGTGVSYGNGVRECVYVDATHLSLYDTGGNPTIASGNWFNGNSPYPGGVLAGQWVALLTRYTIPANPGPIGFFDGTNGSELRSLSTGPANGLASIVVTGGSGGSCVSTACTVTVNLAYNPLSMKFPVSAGEYFSINDTYIGSGPDLDQCGAGGGVQSPFTVASVTSSSYTSTPFTCGGLTTGTYTGIHMACGPASTPNDTVSGTQDCARVSFFATTNNPGWNNLLYTMSRNDLDSSPAYKSWFDGGYSQPGDQILSNYAMAAMRFLVDPEPTPGYTASHSLWLDEVIYGLNNDQRSGGMGYAANSKAWVLVPNNDYGYDADAESLAVLFAVAGHAPEGQYWASSEKTAFLDRTYNDLDDPTQTICTTTNQDAANQSNHNWVLSSGLAASGTNDATHFQLPASDPCYSGTCYGGTGYVAAVVVHAGNSNSNATNDYTQSSYGLVTGHSSSGILTIAGGWTSPQNGGVPASLTNLASATYTSGLAGAVTGTTGQYVCLDFGNYNYELLPLTGVNTIASGTAIKVMSAGPFASAPTTVGINAGCSTAIVTGSPPVTVSSVLGTPFTIFDTFTLSNTTTGAAATVTFSKTPSLAGTINVGDGVMAIDGWYSDFYVASYMSYVTSVGANTLSVINGAGVTGSTSTPYLAWRFPQWTTGDCGRRWASMQNSYRAQGVQPILYGPAAAAGFQLQYNNGTYFLADTVLNGGGSTPAGWFPLDLTIAAYGEDPRATRDLARIGSVIYDFALASPMQTGGRLRDGSGYSNGERPVFLEYLLPVTNTVPAYPNLYGPWLSNLGTWFMFEKLPQLNSGNAFATGWAGQSGYGGQNATFCSACESTPGVTFDPSLFFAPTSNQAAWLRNFGENVNSSGPVWANGLSGGMATTFLLDDPRISDLPYTQQPLQYAFDVNSASILSTYTGQSSTFRTDAVFSRTCWQCASGTSVLFDNATFTDNGGVYDSPRLGNLTAWKGGAVLLGGDTNPSNSFWAIDPTVIGDTFQFNGPTGSGNFLNGNPGSRGMTSVTTVAGSGNAGTYGAQYGDSQSRYAGACGNEAPGYNTANLNILLDHAVRCFVHLKVSGHDEFLFQFDDVALASGSPTASLPMAWHLHYIQNGQTQNGFGGYTTGLTTYLGSNLIESVEDGNSGRTYGLMSYVMSPLPVTLNDDCVGLGGNGQCSPGSTYAGGNGYSHRFTVAGGSSVGANVPKFISVVGHKLLNSLTDTTFTTANLNPDSNWTGVQLTGAKSTGIALFAVGGSTHSSVTSFTTNFSGTGDWLMMGLTPGRYSLTVGGIPVSGSPFTVGPGDGTIYFSSPAGTVVLTGGVPSSPTSLQGQMSITGNVLIH